MGPVWERVHEVVRETLRRLQTAMCSQDANARWINHSGTSPNALGSQNAARNAGRATSISGLFSCRNECASQLAYRRGQPR